MPPANDNLANRTVLGADSGTLTGQSTISATVEGSETDSGFGSHTVWYEFTPSEDGDLVLTVSGGTLDNSTTRLSVGFYSGSGSYPLTRIKLARCDDDNNVWTESGSHQRVAALTGGTTYYFKFISQAVADFGEETAADFDLDWSLVAASGCTPPSYDNIQDAYTLSPAGGTVTFDTSCCTYEANEAGNLEGFPGIWLKLDASAVVGTGGGLAFDVTGVGLTGDVLTISPYLDAWWDPSGTFDPTTPDFTLLACCPGFGSPDNDLQFYGDGTTSPGTKSLSFHPDDNGNSSGIYWIYLSDFRQISKGQVQLTWSAIVEMDCPDGVPVGSFDTPDFDEITSHSAKAHLLICPGGATTDIHVDFGTDPGFGAGTVTIDVTSIPAGNSNVPIDLLLAYCCPSDLPANTTIHVRVRGDNANGFMLSFTGSFATLTESGSPPANDDIGSAQVITGATGSVDGDNWNATQETSENTLLYGTDHTLYGDAPAGDSSVWFEFTPAATGDYAFWTECPDYQPLADRGICDSIITILDGSSFGSAAVVAQNEFAQGQPPGYTGTDVPMSLVNAHLQAGHTYYIGVDSNFGGSSCSGPFRLKWGAAVCAAPALRNTSLVSFAGTSAVFQFDVNPQSHSGNYFGLACSTYAPGPGLFSCSESTPQAIDSFEWSTVTVTINALQPNTPYGSPDGFPTTGQNLAVVENECYTVAGGDEVTLPVTPGFYTEMPTHFAICDAILEDPFTGDDCTSPSGWTLSDGYRIQDAAMGAYLWQEANNAHYNTDLGTLSTFVSLSGDVSVELVAIAGQQDVGLIDTGTGSGYLTRYDTDLGELQLIRLDAGVEALLDSVSIALVDGDQIGFRYDWALTTVSSWVNSGAGWIQMLEQVDTNYNPYDPPMIFAWHVYIAQSTTGGPPAVDEADAFDLSAYGVDPSNEPKYAWSYDGSLGGDAGGRLEWAGPYYGGTGHSDLAPMTCPVWWLDMIVYVFGRIDRYNSVWNSGDVGNNQSYFHTHGGDYAEVPFYPDTVDYATMLSDADTTQGSGFFTWDSDSIAKSFAAIESTISLIQAVFAADGATIETNSAPGGEKAYGLFMPVKVAPGRIDNLRVYDERCVHLFILASLSGARWPRAMQRAHG